jgi:hypothetical protein
MNIMTANPIVKASVFLFFPTAHFLKTISTADHMALLVLSDTKINASQNQRVYFFTNQPENTLNLKLTDE